MDYLDYVMLLLPAVAGFFTVIGSLILIAIGRVMVDVEGKSIEEVKLPFGFRVKTQRPFVVMFLFGTFLLAMPIFMRNQIGETPKLVVRGKIPPEVREGAPGGHGIRVLATADNHDHVTDDISLTVPLLKTQTYRIYYYDDDCGYLYDEPVDWTNVQHGEYSLPGFALSNQRLFRSDQCGRSTPSQVNAVKESPDRVSQFHAPEVTR